MTGPDAAEGLTPYRAERGFGAILFDAARMRQADPRWFTPSHWGDGARPVDSGGRGAAWFVEAPFGQAVLRRYLRGGLVAAVVHDRYWWNGAARTRSFHEYRVTREAIARGVPVPPPIAALYERDGLHYRAAILVQRLPDVRSFADRAAVAGEAAPWEETGRLVARCHRAGLDHADLNAHNLLFDHAGRGWVIDLDRARLRIPDTAWRLRNLSRLHRSVTKLRGERAREAVDADFARLRAAYERAWERGI